jgi:hypothetical protein
MIVSQGFVFVVNIVQHKPIIALGSMVSILLKIMRDGDVESEQCEAVKALLYLYRTFQSDFRNPFNTFILPQLMNMTNCHWKVRAQICACILGYGIYSPEVILALILRLVDKNEIVRNVALKTLAHFGITTKQSLTNAMIMVGLLPKKKESMGDYLDVLLAELHKKERVLVKQSIKNARDWASTSHAFQPLCPLELPFSEETARAPRSQFSARNQVANRHWKSGGGDRLKLQSIMNADIMNAVVMKTQSSKSASLMRSEAQARARSGLRPIADDVIRAPLEQRLLRSPYTTSAEMDKRPRISLSAAMASVRPLTAGSLSAAARSKSRPQSAYVASFLVERKVGCGRMEDVQHVISDRKSFK